ncbi:MAG: NUDIX domain-containing protein [Candidatus Berkelbacteria bacterium]|nr:NUDIX domain-containing protein [Candidatus Berkelbacteria bacterium]MCR4307992.1 NUDIX domain-containing protein [Candidatus Berkelbacteria bacterium]
MQEVTKILMFAYRRTNGQAEFFVLYRHDGTKSILSGHVGDNIPDETLEQAARRETIEELGVEPISLINLDHKEVVELKTWDKLSTEWAFLIEIPNKDVQYLEGDEEHGWYSLDELEEVLTWPNHQRVVSKIRQILSN